MTKNDLHVKIVIDLGTRNQLLQAPNSLDIFTKSLTVCVFFTCEMKIVI